MRRSEIVSREGRDSAGRCAKGSRREAPRWFAGNAVAMALLAQLKASSCRLICAYRCRRSGSAASSRLGPTRSFDRWRNRDDRSIMSLRQGGLGGVVSGDRKLRGNFEWAFGCWLSSSAKVPTSPHGDKIATSSVLPAPSWIRLIHRNCFHGNLAPSSQGLKLEVSKSPLKIICAKIDLTRRSAPRGFRSLPSCLLWTNSPHVLDPFRFQTNIAGSK